MYIGSYLEQIFNILGKYIIYSLLWSLKRKLFERISNMARIQRIKNQDIFYRMLNSKVALRFSSEKKDPESF